MACIVAGPTCRLHANLTPARTPRTRCYACGLPVCTDCSARVCWYGPTVRVCDNCLTQDGREAEVLQRLRSA